MKSLSKLVLETQKYFLSQIKKEMETVDDREELDMYLDNLKMDCEFISDELPNQPSAFMTVYSFSKLLQEYGQNSISKELDFGLARTVTIEI